MIILFAVVLCWFFIANVTVLAELHALLVLYTFLVLKNWVVLTLVAGTLPSKVALYLLVLQMLFVLSSISFKDSFMVVSLLMSLVFISTKGKQLLNMYKFIFVCGAGRSGTHFVGDLLNTSDKVKLVDENGQVYVWLKRAAMSRFSLLSFIYAIGAGMLAMCIGIINYGKIVVFKSHPSIWSYEVLNSFIPNAGYFIVQRSP